MAAAQLLALSAESVVGVTLAGVSHPFDLGGDEQQWQALQAGTIDSYIVERQLADASGRPVPVLMAVSRMPTRTEGAQVIVHLVDLRAQRQLEQQAAYLTDHDPLTGLFNRRRFEEELRRHLLRVTRHGASGAVLLLDLDQFKYVNDTLGHAVGDIVLRTVADTLAGRVRGEDVLARLGGDEFAILLPDAKTTEDVQAAATDILAVVVGTQVALPEDPQRPAAGVHLSASIGAALIPAFADADRLMTAADLAMYEAKEAGPGQLRIHSADSAHAERIRAGFTWGDRIRRALAERRFELHLQPIVPLQGAKDPQYEVLLRLRDGDWLWHPSEFLRHAERLGLMVAIDRYVIDHAVRLLAGLPRHRRPRLEVNLSAASLGEEQLADWIAERLHRHGVLSRDLIFEITETVAIANMPLAAATIRRLRAGGSGFALDDFGVGVSSFYYLRELPFDVLKIDGEFVRDLPTSRANQLIVRAMIDTAHGLGKAAVAEYVESFEVSEILRRLGCDFAQGQFFGMPQPAGDVLAD
jgi:diguanylate cyclase (GGDEF)-like protein